MATPAESQRAAVEQRLLGWGAAAEPIAPGVDVGRDLVLARGANGRDLATVAGVPNLVQALETALTTALGDDVFNTAFGFDGVRMLATGTDPALTREGIRVAVVDVLRRDPRIARVVEVELVAAPAAAGADERRTTGVRCVVETVTGEPLGVTVGGLVPGV